MTDNLNIFEEGYFN